MTISTLIRPTWAEIDQDAFRHNMIALAARLSRRVKIMAVLKADAYGHGAVPLARVASAALHATAREGTSFSRLWGFGVSSVEEGLQLRGAGLREKILILGSLYPFESFNGVLENRLTPTVSSRAAAQALARRASRRGGPPAPCHVKIDTGMGRIGMSPATGVDALPVFLQNPWLRVEGVYTHLACADSAAATERQRRLFEQATVGFQVKGGLRHLCNSGGLLARPSGHYDLVRPGLALYGMVPWPALRRGVDLKPVLTWKTRVVFVKTVRRGTPLSYGWTWRARRRSRVVTLPVGYADGYRRSLSNGGEVLVRGRRCPVVGRVTMDQILVDVTGLPGVEVGEEVVLIGRQGRDRLTVEEMAERAGTIPYEVVCGLSKRVPRIYR